MNGLQRVFQYEGAQVRTINDDGEPWFIAKDICDILEIDSTQTRRIDDDEKGLRLVQTPGGPQEVLCVNEPGLYSLILGSRKPEARNFKRWITHEVLPAIRKTGAYVSPTGIMDEYRRMDIEARIRNAKTRQAKLMLKTADEFQNLLSSESRTLLINEAMAVLTGNPNLLPLPKIKKSYTATEMGEIFRMSANAFGRFANAAGLKESEYGFYVLDKSPYSPKQVESWRYNERAVERARELISANGDANG